MTLVRKRFRPDQADADPRHFAYWRRELLAYTSNLLPQGPGLAAPVCHAVTDDAVFLDDVQGPPESPSVAAQRLGAWQAEPAPDELPWWVAGHQLAQRVAAKDLDWTDVDVEERLRSCWERREELLARLESVPFVLSHGDFHLGHLIATGPEVTTVIDWATLGMSPVGADLAHLALSTQQDLLTDYLRGLDASMGEVAPGYAVTLGLTAASRFHWMRTRGVEVPDGFVEFVLGQLTIIGV
jgi:hypothetical protein